MALRNRLAGAGSRPPQAALVKSRGRERCAEKAPLRRSERDLWLPGNIPVRPKLTHNRKEFGGIHNHEKQQRRRIWSLQIDEN